MGYSYLLVPELIAWETDKHWVFTDTKTFTQNFSEPSSVTVLLSGTGQLKFARDEREAWAHMTNSETEHRFDSS